MKFNFAFSSLFAVLASSLCCITPVLAFTAGIGGIASSFSWLEPAQPYLLGMGAFFLSLAWWQKLKPQSKAGPDCDCEPERASFWKSKKFLGIITVLAIALSAFPYYAEAFYPSSGGSAGAAPGQAAMPPDSGGQRVQIQVSGMTCQGCQSHVESACGKLEGVSACKADYKTGQVSFRFDSGQVSKNQILEAINKTGYKVEQ